MGVEFSSHERKLGKMLLIKMQHRQSVQEVISRHCYVFFFSLKPFTAYYKTLLIVYLTDQMGPNKESSLLGFA